MAQSSNHPSSDSASPRQADLPFPPRIVEALRESAQFSDVSGTDLEADWARVQQAMTAAQPASRASRSLPDFHRGPSPTSRRASRAGAWVAGVGVALCLAIGATFLVQRYAIWNPSGHLSPTVYTTGLAQRSTVRLADGSTMILGPATSVQVTDRDIYVAGEAYFTVVPHATHPVVVRTDDAVVRVLGTAFAVRRYAEEGRTRVVVENGRVALRTLGSRQRHNEHSETHTVLSARMLALVTDSGITVTPGISTSEYTSWTRGTLVFTEATLRDVVTELVRAYGVDIQISDTTLAKQLVRIEVSVTEDSLNQVLESLCNVTDAHYVVNTTRQGRAYVLLPGHLATQTPRNAPSRHSFPQPEQGYGR